MSPDIEKMIEICKKPEVQALIRKCFPPITVIGDSCYQGFVWAENENEVFKVFAINTQDYEDIEEEVLLPFGFDESRACSQIDVLLMEAKKISNPGELRTYFKMFEAANTWKLNIDFHSDLYLKIMWLDELIKEGEDA